MQRVNDQDSSARLVDPTHDSEQEQARSLDPSGIPAADLCRLMLTDPEERVSAALCDVARRLPLTPPDAVAIARELAIHHDSWLVQSAAIRLLESARPVEAATVDVLITLLSSTDEKRQRLAALALGLLGDSATPALPALRAALESADPVTKLNAAEAISKIEAAIARTPPAPDDASDTDQPPSQRRG
jgi:HEAT repeat protein